jgi:outer membrane protein assembly factor BamB
MNLPISPRLAVGLFLVVVLSITSAQAENWPQWRGAKLDGISDAKGVPTTWSKTENVVWRLPLPGMAGSTPVVWDKQIFLTSADGGKLVLMSISTAGKPLWKETIATRDEMIRGDEGNFASPSPSTDGKHVWALFGTGDLVCYSIRGKQAWKFNVGDRYGKLDIAFGLTSTPVLDGDRLYLQLIHTGGAHVVALNKNTGKEIWKQNRPSDARDECLHSYASPVLYRDGNTELLLTHGADLIVAHNLKDGKEVWRCGGLNPKGTYNNTLRFVASPVAVPGMIIVPSAKNGPVLALDPKSKGDISDSDEGHFWTRESNTPDVPSPLVVDGLVYLAREDGSLLCLDAKSGEQIYRERGYVARHRASPLYADGKIFLTARDGTINVVKAGREYELLATNKMEEEMSSSPVIAGGVMYLRTFNALYAIGTGK